MRSDISLTFADVTSNLKGEPPLVLIPIVAIADVPSTTVSLPGVDDCRMAMLPALMLNTDNSDDSIDKYRCLILMVVDRVSGQM